MIVLFELIALSGLIWGLVLAARAFGKHQKLYYPVQPSVVYLKKGKAYANRSVWRFPFTSPIVKVYQYSKSICVGGDVLTQFGVVNTEFVLNARINNALVASTFAPFEEFSSEQILYDCSQKIKSVLQQTLNEAGNASMSYTPKLHTTTQEKMKELCNSHGLELEEISFKTLELKTDQNISVEHKQGYEDMVLERFNSGRIGEI